MPSPSPLQLRIQLANVDRGLDLVAKLIVDRDPDTPAEHVILRVLAWCLFHEEGLRIADGPPRRDLPDLSVTRLDGKPATYIACGAADGEELRRLMNHNRGVRVRALFDQEAPREHFLRQVSGIKKRPPGFEDLEIWSIEHELSARLATRTELRQRWAVTVVTDHVYVATEGLEADSAVTRTPMPPFTP